MCKDIDECSIDTPEFKACVRPEKVKGATCVNTPGFGYGKYFRSKNFFDSKT